ncbi:MAG: glycosyltransferase [Rhizomicrobium sp.]
MRVFLAATCLSPHYGGPAVSVSRLALALCGADAHVGLWAQDGSASATQLLPPQMPDRLTRLSGPASEALSSFSPDILHDNGLWLRHNHRLAALASHRGLARVVSTRGMLEPWARNHKKWKKDLAWALYQRRDLMRAQAIHATAASEAQNVARLNLNVPVHMIPNGVDIPDLPVRKSAGTDVTPRTALFLGRLYPVKGLPMLIEAWNCVRPHGWRLVLAGPDEAGHRAVLEALIRNAGLTEIISFAGPLAGPAKLECLAGADLFILPSFSESFGIAIAEALAHGLPVLTTHGTPWPMLRERSCGWTIEATVDGIADGLRIATSQDPKLLKAMGAKGRAWMASEFGWENVARQFIATYEEILRG